jgi:hypothetical protein
MRRHVQNLLLYFLDKSQKLVLKYWPSDFNLPDEQETSVFGVNKLKPFATEIREMPQFGMEVLICEVNSETRNIIVEDMKQAEERIMPWYYLELLDQRRMILLLIAEHGNDVLMNLSDQDLHALRENNYIDTNLLHSKEKALMT